MIMNKDLICGLIFISIPIVFLLFLYFICLIGMFLDWIASFKKLPKKFNKNGIRYIKETDSAGKIQWYIQFCRMFILWKYETCMINYGSYDNPHYRCIHKPFKSLEDAKNYITDYYKEIEQKKIKNIITKEIVPYC